MKIKELIKDDRGNILLLTIGVIFIFLAFLAVVVDFGRYVVVKEKLQIASDAASLAGAKSADRWVRLKIDPGASWEVDDNGDPYCESCGKPFEVVGTEAELLDNEGWMNYCCSCGCGGMKILDRWVDYKNGGTDAIQAANTVFELNRPYEMDTGQGGSASVTVNPSYLSQTNRSSPLYPSVIVQVQGRIKTVLLNILKIVSPSAKVDYMDISTCSQGRTYYKDVSNGKWQRPPDNYCQN